MSASIPTGGIHGLMAEFDSATELVAAANKTREAGFVDVDAYSPIPIEELHHAIGFKATKLPLMVLIGGLLGGSGGFTLHRIGTTCPRSPLRSSWDYPFIGGS